MRFKCSRCESRLDVNYARGARFMVCRGCGTYAFEPFEVVMERLPQGGKRP
jgi:ribosomal protein S27E